MSNIEDALAAARAAMPPRTESSSESPTHDRRQKPQLPSLLEQLEASTRKRAVGSRTSSKNLEPRASRDASEAAADSSITFSTPLGTPNVPKVPIAARPEQSQQKRGSPSSKTFPVSTDHSVPVRRTAGALTASSPVKPADSDKSSELTSDEQQITPTKTRRARLSENLPKVRSQPPLNPSAPLPSSRSTIVDKPANDIHQQPPNPPRPSTKRSPPKCSFTMPIATLAPASSGAARDSPDAAVQPAGDQTTARLVEKDATAKTFSSPQNQTPGGTLHADRGSKEIRSRAHSILKTGSFFDVDERDDNETLDPPSIQRLLASSRILEKKMPAKTTGEEHRKRTSKEDTTQGPILVLQNEAADALRPQSRRWAWIVTLLELILLGLLIHTVLWLWGDAIFRLEWINAAGRFLGYYIPMTLLRTLRDVASDWWADLVSSAMGGAAVAALAAWYRPGMEPPGPPRLNDTRLSPVMEHTDYMRMGAERIAEIMTDLARFDAHALVRDGQSVFETDQVRVQMTREPRDFLPTRELFEGFYNFLQEFEAGMHLGLLEEEVHILSFDAQAAKVFSHIEDIIRPANGGKGWQEYWAGTGLKRLESLAGLMADHLDISVALRGRLLDQLGHGGVERRSREQHENICLFSGKIATEHDQGEQQLALAREYFGNGEGQDVSALVDYRKSEDLMTKVWHLVTSFHALCQMIKSDAERLRSFLIALEDDLKWFGAQSRFLRSDVLVVIKQMRKDKVVLTEDTAARLRVEATIDYFRRTRDEWQRRRSKWFVKKAGNEQN
ncbi:hypothetical protein QBC47DRAFT_365974 [Echria macrotheca]|uniref:Uncharacterized protein n=1 Tax=Echria macrotheca TaxID=438768 RepID=A0AAJ0B579_9PEZI|nr:hypothetical protein QBC47DRAFT_365974 [Echria macrotheca]